MFKVKTIQEWVEKAQKSKVIKGFLPQAIMKDIDLPLKVVINECLDLVKEGKLNVIYEALCPNCFNIITCGDKPKPRTVDYCLYCGEEEIEVTQNDYLPRFFLV